MTLQTAGAINHDSGLRQDHYIPVGRRDLVELMIHQAGLDETEGGSFRRFAEQLESRFHLEFYTALRDLSECYSAFDPDCILVDLQHEGEATEAEKRRVFFQQLCWLLERANFHRLSHDDIQGSLESAKMFGIRLEVDFDAFQHLEVYVRGETLDEWVVRKWYRLFRKETVDVPVYRRLVLVFQNKPEAATAEEPSDGIFLKVFKNIPRSDIDILLPSSRVKLTMIDRGKIILPTVSGIGLTLYKVLKAGFVITLFSGIYGLIAFLTLIGGTIGYGVKSFFGYLRTKDKYQLSLTQHLYYQNLGNNRGVLYRILNDAEEQEFREAMIAYYLMWRDRGDEQWSQERLDRSAEKWLEELTGLQVDFEVDDALAKLERLGLAEQSEGGWRCVSLAAATERLQKSLGEVGKSQGR